MRQRIHAGLQRAVANGKTLGLAPNNPEVIDKARQGLAKGLGINKVARQVGLSNSTVARLKAVMVASIQPSGSLMHSPKRGVSGDFCHLVVEDSGEAKVGGVLVAEAELGAYLVKE